MKLLHWDEINPLTNTPYTFGDPNLFFGEDGKGYARQPGDPGFVPYASASTPSVTPSKRKKHMPKSDYIKNRDAEFSAQLQTFKLNIPSYATALNVSAPQITEHAKDADCFAYTLACQEVCGNCSQQWTAWKDIMRGGGDAGTAPEGAVFPAAVPVVAPGIEARFRALVKHCKSQPGYNAAAGEALGIEGPVHTGPDFAVFRPLLKVELSGGQPLVRWGWQGQSAHLDMIELLVDRGDGAGYALLAFDTTPDYLDTHGLPTPAAKWTYKAIFRVGDTRVGQWSDEVSITVGG
jgi:hypothetical protein